MKQLGHIDTRVSITALGEVVSDLFTRTGESSDLMKYYHLFTPGERDQVLYAGFLDEFQHEEDTDTDAEVNYLAALEDLKEELEDKLRADRAADEAEAESFAALPQPTEETNEGAFVFEKDTA